MTVWFLLVVNVHINLRTLMVVSVCFYMRSQQGMLENIAHNSKRDKKLSYHRGTARCVVSVEILPIATQQCRNYLYDKS